MGKITTIEQGINALFEVNELGKVPNYTLVPRKDGEYTDHLIIGDKTYPIFDWRNTAPTALVSWIAQTGIGSTCSFKASGAIGSNVGLDRYLDC